VDWACRSYLQLTSGLTWVTTRHCATRLEAKGKQDVLLVGVTTLYRGPLLLGMNTVYRGPLLVGVTTLYPG
jgi:hypothetical protein